MGQKYKLKTWSQSQHRDVCSHQAGSSRWQYRQSLLHMDGVLIQPPSVSSIPRLRTKAHGIFSHGSHFPPHNANLKILWDVQDRLTCQLTHDLALIFHPSPESGCLYWHSHGVMKAMLTGLTQRVCTVAIHELTLTWLHNHRFLLLSSQDKHFTISLSAYVLLFFLSFSAWSPLPPFPSQLSFVLLLWDMAFFSFQGLFRLNNTIFYFSGKYYIFFRNDSFPIISLQCQGLGTHPNRAKQKLLHRMWNGPKYPWAVKAKMGLVSTIAHDKQNRKLGADKEKWVQCSPLAPMSKVKTQSFIRSLKTVGHFHSKSTSLTRVSVTNPSTTLGLLKLTTHFCFFRALGDTQHAGCWTDLN